MNVSKVIEDLGGSVKVSRIFGVTVGAISQWKSANHIPEARLMYLRLAYPDVFAVDHTEAQISKEEESCN